MKSKSLTYFLIIIVALVWGVIIYRVFDATTGDKDFPVANTTPIPKKESIESYSEERDTAKLLLNYRDPFADKPKTDPKVIPISKLISDKPVLKAIPKPAINWNFISYSGYIKNARSKRLLTMVTINGKTYSMTDGETADKVKLLKNMIDSIKIAYNGTTKYIVMNSK